MIPKKANVLAEKEIWSIHISTNWFCKHPKDGKTKIYYLTHENVLLKTTYKSPKMASQF